MLTPHIIDDIRAVLAAIIEWCQDHTDELTADQSSRLAAALIAASVEKHGELVLAVEDLGSGAAADLWVVAYEIARSHNLEFR